MPFALLLWFAAANDIEDALRKMAELFTIVETQAADPADPNQAFYEGALPGLMRRLDPHSAFFTPGQFDQLRELERSTSKGFGTVVSVLPGRVIVLQTMPGTPSARAGISAGDEIIAVNGIRLNWLSPDQLVGLLGETRRKEARLDVRRPGTPRILQFTMSPADIDTPAVDRAFRLEPEIGYVRITSFERDTGPAVRQSIESLGGTSLKGLVLDLRNNPGGLLDAAVATAALFLPPSTTVMATRGRARPAEESKTPKNAVPYPFPLAILMNEKSASASEIVAGAMQDHRRATVVGEQSFGKGLVQSVYPLSQGTGMALTTALYYTPAGRSIQRPLKEGQLHPAGEGGIRPDVLVAPEGFTRLRAYLDASGSITSFATDYIRRGEKIDAGFTVSGQILDDLQGWLADRAVRPGVSEWAADRDWIRSRLHQEIFNQTLGVAKGDEVEARRDPQARKAIESLRSP